jgi:PPOX class probable F420-dependent enzyme
MHRAEAATKLRNARVGRLATVRPDGRPHVVPVAFAVGPDRSDDGQGLRVYWAVDSKPKRSTELQRLRNIAAHPHAELVVDGYDENWDRLWWVRASGTSATVDDTDERAVAINALSTKYRQYAAEPPSGPVVVIEVDRVVGWRAAA